MSVGKGKVSLGAVAGRLSVGTRAVGLLGDVFAADVFSAILGAAVV